jgi:hypothetical protein
MVLYYILCKETGFSLCILYFTYFFYPDMYKCKERENQNLIISQVPSSPPCRISPSASPGYNQCSVLPTPISASCHRVPKTVDGGITPELAPEVVNAGATVLVAGAAVFCGSSIAEALQRMKRAIGSSC